PDERFCHQRAHDDASMNVSPRSRRGLAARLLRCLILFLLVSWCFGGQARADQPPVDEEVLVVEIAQENALIDPAKLRDASAEELGVAVVGSEDSRAAGATGRLTVKVQTGDQKLVVEFRRLGTLVVRTVALPADAEHAVTTAVFLAGNLARDEASELVNRLRS